MQLIHESIASPELLNSEKINGFHSQVLRDLWICLVSRETSLMGRREVLTGKAKFGILGDGKEVPQVAAARFFKKGDWRSGYYRDQTFIMGIGKCSVEEYFAQLYADADNDPFSGGRQMNSHYATPTIDENGDQVDLTKDFNISSDISCTGGQMARGAGLALASKLFRASKSATLLEGRSNDGDEVCLVTIGDASTSEGAFWESMNAAAVNKIPMVTAVWDDGYGISVPKKFQTVKASISKALEGFLIDEDGSGIYIFSVNGWDYSACCAVFEKAYNLARKEHVPCLVHVQELTQPQGHSTSGSHERYKDKERLKWERAHDCIDKMVEWVLETNIATKEDIDILRKEAKTYVREAKNRAWKMYADPNKKLRTRLQDIYEGAEVLNADASIQEHISGLMQLLEPTQSEIIKHARVTTILADAAEITVPQELHDLLDSEIEITDKRYHSHLYSETQYQAINVPVVNKEFDETPEQLNGYQILNKYFDKKFGEDERLVAFGEDVGHIGDVNQGFAGLQEKYGVNRIFDTGIREWTIMGYAIGLAMRGLRPIAEIQYLDYLLYGLAPLSDDLATLRYRSNGIQSAPAIIRTRGHRLEGIWHAGSPMGLLLNSLKGMCIITPRNMVQAAGFYNTMLQSDDPALIIEPLNGYRYKEEVPSNLGEYSVPLGQPEILREGTDITLVTYGSCVREAIKALEYCDACGYSVELIDVQCLQPFDLEGMISESLKKTNRVLFVDEDVQGGATAHMMQKVLEEQDGYKYLDAKPATLAAKDHRPPYGSDGDYYTKPNPENIYEMVRRVMMEIN